MWTKDAGEVQMHFLVQSKTLYTLTLQIVENASQKIAMGSAAAVLSGVLLVLSVYLMIRHGAKAKALVLSLVTKEGKMVWGFLGEGFDMVGDYAMFLAIRAAFNDTQENYLKAAPVYFPALVSLVVSTIVSLAALAVRGTMTVTQLRRRRRELKDFGKRKGYVELLEVKIEDAERQCKQTYIGIALAIFEQAPMAGIGIFFLSHTVPWFQLVSIFTSGVMLGIKVAATATLPYWWAKVKKWQASARPVRKRALLGTELVIASLESGDASNGADEPASLIRSLHELRSFTRRVARSAEQLSTPNAEVLAQIIDGLVKIDHKVCHYIDTLSAPEDPEPKPKSGMVRPLLTAADRAPRVGLAPLHDQLNHASARSLDCLEAHGGMHCAQRMFTAWSRRQVPACIRRLLGLDEAVDNNDNKAVGELVGRARAPRADEPKGLVVQAQCCLALRAFANNASEDALTRMWRRNPREVDHFVHPRAPS
jgi:hypothetical protein